MKVSEVSVDIRIIASREFRAAWANLMAQRMPYASFRALSGMEKSLNDILAPVKEKADSLKEMDPEEAQKEMAEWLEEQEEIPVVPVVLYADKTMVLTPQEYQILSSVIVFK